MVLAGAVTLFAPSCKSSALRMLLPPSVTGSITKVGDVSARAHFAKSSRPSAAHIRRSSSELEPAGSKALLVNSFAFNQNPDGE